MSNAKIGVIVDVHPNSVSTYVKAYKQQGFDGLCRKNYQPQKSPLEEYSLSIIDDFSKNPICSINQAINRIKELTGIERKPTQVKAFLHRHGFVYRKMAAIPGKVDVDKQRQWIETDLNPVIEKAEQGKVELLFCDAAHFTLSAFLCMVWARSRMFLNTSHGRNRINVLGMINALSKEVTTLINNTYITAQTIIEFMDILKDKYQTPIVLVMDNAKYQRCNLVIEKAKQMDITILFLPPYSPNLNIIERIWKFTRKKILYAKYYDNADKFHATVRDFFSQINDNFNDELSSLMTLKFQLFDKINSQNMAA